MPKKPTKTKKPTSGKFTTVPPGRRRRPTTQTPIRKPKK